MHLLPLEFAKLGPAGSKLVDVFNVGLEDVVLLVVEALEMLVYCVEVTFKLFDEA